MDTVGFRTLGGCAARMPSWARGRLNATFITISQAAMVLGGVIWGFAASMAGVSYALLGAAVLFLASLLLAAQLFDHRLINAPSS
jgi:ABC-type multidrug transport system permease subunit